MRPVIYLLLFVTVALTSCTSGPSKKEKTMSIVGRDRVFTYLCTPLPGWNFHPPEADVDLHDSTLPLATWTIDGAITVVVHNFPGMSIPPGAQLSRWQKQLLALDPTATRIEPVAWGGFAGLELLACEEEGVAILGWAMSMPSFHRYSIQGSPRSEEITADWTIKATGPIEAIAARENEIRIFAHSFRLKHEISSP